MEHLLFFFNQSVAWVNQLFEREIDSRYEYHNLRHTLDVIKQAEQIGIAEAIAMSDLQLVKIAALYHDTGFSRARKNHEEHSVQLFLEHSSNSSLSDYEKEQISACILATRMPQCPKTHLEQILCDADLDYLGRSDFFDIGESLRRELIYAGEIQPEDSWDEIQIRFLESHQYKTAYAIDMNTRGVEENLKRLRLGLRKQP